MNTISLKKTRDLLIARQSDRNTTVTVKSVTFGGDQIPVIAGPCAIESEDTLRETAFKVRGSGAVVLRGGAFKPRTSPYSYQGMGVAGLECLARVGEDMNMPVITELMDGDDLGPVLEYADIIQIGARNMYNYSLLRKLGAADKPVVLKRGLSATIEEWLLAAEYILAAGNPRVMLCERGIRNAETWTRNALDLAAVALVKQLSHLPVLVDPSHGTGVRSLVAPMSLAAVAAGADGLMIEVHPRPETALSDGEQSLTPRGFSRLIRQLEPLAAALGRRIR